MFLLKILNKIINIIEIINIYIDKIININILN